MEHIYDIIFSLIGGSAGGMLVASYLSKKIFEHRLAKSFERYKFIISNRTRVVGELLRDLGRSINSARDIERNKKFEELLYNRMLDSINQLEESLYPSYVLIEEEIYNKIHTFKNNSLIGKPLV